MEVIERKLNEIRQKPKTTRAQIAFTAALSVAGVVALLWSFTLPGKLASIGGTEPVIAVAEEDREGFLAGMRNSAALIFGSSETESDADEVVAEPVNTIDVEALLAQPLPAASEREMAPGTGESTGLTAEPAVNADAGSVILIATSTPN